MDAFDYFRNPTQPLSSWSSKPGDCHFCGRTGPGFDGPYYGIVDDVERVCESCLRVGRLMEIDVTTLEGHPGAIAQQLDSERADLNHSERQALVTKRSDELRYCTPALTTWQAFTWPAHCGDYCQFIEELGKPEIVELAARADPKRWFLAHANNAGPGVWAAVRERSARKYPSENYDLGVYRFQCRECSETILNWDMS